MENQKISIKKLTCGPIVKGIVQEDGIHTTINADANTNDTNDINDHLGRHSIRIWFRGEKNTHGIIKLKEDHPSVTWKDYRIIPLDQRYDYTTIVDFNGLKPGTCYQYQVGVIYNKDLYDTKFYDWSNIDNYGFRTENSDQYINKSWSFVFGSCRRYVKVGFMTLFGTGKQADKIYESISRDCIDFFMSIGDQVYFDPIGDFLRIKNKKDMEKLYRKIFNFPHLKCLMGNFPTYLICDDHDIHRNNSCRESKMDELDVWENGLDTYMEYQHYSHPSRLKSKNIKLWYIFDRNNATFFVMDTRTKRNELNKNKKIIDQDQMNNFKEWIKIKNNKIKFVVSSVPIVSQNTDDSWFGFPEQQAEVIDEVVKTKNCFLLTGDAHCARNATYDVINSFRQHIGKVVEILSSGLAAINHDIGHKYGMTNKKKHSDFPTVVNNTQNDGYKFVITRSIDSHPRPNRPRGIDYIRQIATRVVDNVYTKITVNQHNVCAKIFNQNGKCLDTTIFDLTVKT
jgi:alkaline phosphatase D